MTIDKYAQDGVNVAVGDDFSSFAGHICRESYHNTDRVEVIDTSRGYFRGPRGWRPKGLPTECFLTTVMDGIGTKVVLIDAADTFTEAANDVVAMTAMDITRYGGLPLVFTSILDVDSLGEPGSARFQAAEQLLYGLSRVANQCGYVILNGETAELGQCVGSPNPGATLSFNWGAAMTGVYHPDKMIRGDTLRAGQAVVVLREQGFRSNGISSVRKALAMRYGDDWYSNAEARPDILAAAKPSEQYDDLINDLHGWFQPDLKARVNLHLVVHLSGGAFKGKFGEVIAQHDLSADLPHLFPPPAIMESCRVWRGMTGEEAYQTWNGGQGALLVLDANEADWVVDQVGRDAGYGIEANIAGHIVPKASYNVRISSQFGDGGEIFL